MSDLISKHKVFFAHLIDSDASLNQIRAALETITNKQIDLISEIAHNLLHHNFHSKAKQSIARLSKILRRLANTKINKRTKRNTLFRYSNAIAHLLKKVSPELKELI
jgi:predicted thioredoxin/glutaredoxin